MHCVNLVQLRLLKLPSDNSLMRNCIAWHLCFTLLESESKMPIENALNKAWPLSLAHVLVQLLAMQESVGLDNFIADDIR